MELELEIETILRTLMLCASPSGNEERIGDVFSHAISPFVDDVQCDIYGNVVAVKRGKTDKKIAIFAHADEVGLIVHYIDENGFLYFKELGGIDTNILPTQRVCIEGKDGSVYGIIGKKPIHLQDKTDGYKEIAPEDLWIDIAAGNKEEAERLVEIGATATIVNTPVLMNNHVVGGRGLDNKIGLSILMLTAKALSRRQTECTICYMVSVQEELGGRGVQMLCNEYKPKVGVVIDVTHATDYPTMSAMKNGQIIMGGGVVIASAPSVYRGCFREMVSLANTNGVRYQLEILAKPTGTDVAVVQVSSINVETGLLCVPCRYMHTPNEMVAVQDAISAVQLLEAYCLQRK